MLTSITLLKVIHDQMAWNSELLQFFTEVLNEKYDNGTPKLAADYVIMDNCGFHHARHVEPIMRQILLQHGVTLVFQPPYSPKLNPCEYAFKSNSC